MTYYSYTLLLHHKSPRIFPSLCIKSSTPKPSEEVSNYGTNRQARYLTDLVHHFSRTPRPSKALFDSQNSPYLLERYSKFLHHSPPGHTVSTLIHNHSTNYPSSSPRSPVRHISWTFLFLLRSIIQQPHQSLNAIICPFKRCLPFVRSYTLITIT